jgi:hypothetical protein
MARRRTWITSAVGVWLLPALTSLGTVAAAIIGVTWIAVVVERRSEDVRVALEIAGPERPDAGDLAAAAASALGEPVEVVLRWRFGDRAAAAP